MTDLSSGEGNKRSFKMCSLRSINNPYRRRKEMQITEGGGKRGLEPQGTVSVDADVSFEERGPCLHYRVVFNCR